MYFVFAVVVVASASSDMRVEVPVAALMQSEAHKYVDQHAEQRGPHHRDRVEELWRVQKPHEGFVQEADSEHPYKNDARESSERLSSVVAESEVAVDAC